MKKQRPIKKILATIVAVWALMASASAQDWWNIIQKLSLRGALDSIIRALIYLISTIAVLFLIVGGYWYVTSAGNPDQLGKAKNTILYAIIGLVIAFLAYVIVTYVLGVFGIKK